MASFGKKLILGLTRGRGWHDWLFLHDLRYSTGPGNGSEGEGGKCQRGNGLVCLRRVQLKRVCPVITGVSAAGFFDVIEAGIEDLLDAMQFGRPEVAHVVEALVYAVKLGVDVGQQEADEGGVGEDRNADGQVKLLVGHGRAAS